MPLPAPASLKQKLKHAQEDPAALSGAGPSPALIRATRDQYGLTQKQAGELVQVAQRTWQNWELGSRDMPAGLWELFLIKTKRRIPKA